MKRKAIVAGALCLVAVALSIGCLNLIDCDKCGGTGIAACEVCGGDGVIEKKETYQGTCTDCNGKGTVRDQGLDVLGFEIGGTTKTCSKCGGSGTVSKTRTIEKPCPACDGTGKVTCTKCGGDGKY